MAAKAAISEETASASKVKLPILTMLLVVILGSLIGSGAVVGGLFFLVKSGKIPSAAMAGGDARSAREVTHHMMVLEPILVNLADEGGHAYLRLGLTLDVDADATKSEAGTDVKGGKALTEQELAVRDTVLTVLGQQTSAWLLGPDGKEHLKIELKEALARHNEQLKVKDVFFTDFLVQI